MKHTRKRRQPPKIAPPAVKTTSSLRINPKVLFPWFICALTLIVLLVLNYSPLLKIRTINCTYVNDLACPPEITAELDKFLRVSSLTVNTGRLSQKLTAVEPQAAQVDVSVKLPDTLEIQFRSQELLANIKVATVSASLIVSKDHVVVGQSLKGHPHLPDIIYPQAAGLRIGDRISDSTLSFGLRLITLLSQSFINTSQISLLSDRLITVTLAEGKTALFTTHYDLTRQVTSLQLILSKSTIATDYPVIDVRYEQPVLRPFR